MRTQQRWVTLAVAGLIGLSLMAWVRWPASLAPLQAASVPQELSFQWEYAVLQFNRDPNSYQFTYGDNILGQNGSTLGNLMVLIQGRTTGQPTLANLLNVIGAQGWELFAFNEQNGSQKFIFKRIR